MKFIAPCFVRIEDAKRRKELIEWLKEIGHRDVYTDFSDNSISIMPFTGRCVDCGTNIDLLKALAAMNDSYAQWLICLTTFEISAAGFETAEPTIVRAGTIAHREDDIVVDLKYWREATATEIVEHFKTKQP